MSFNVQYTVNTGAGTAMVVPVTSSGDLVVTSADDYIVTDDAGNGTGDPTLVHVVSNPTARIEPSSYTRSSDITYLNFQFTLAPGERAILMQLHAQTTNRSVAATRADALWRLQGSALSGISADEQADVLNFFAYPDTDQDGLSNADEVTQGTGVTDPDSDDDLMFDGFEVRNGLNPLVNDAGLDPDDDGLTNLEEMTAGTGVNNPDTDNDALDDGAEVETYDSDPLDTDTDDDDLTDGMEANIYSSDPTVDDSDAGGRDDGLEVWADGTNPVVPNDDRPTVTLTHVLTDGGGYEWDIGRFGQTAYGSDSAFYDGMLAWNIIVDGVGTRDPINLARATTEDAFRELQFFRHMAPLRYWRKIFVPTNETFARYLEVLTNDATTPLTVTLQIVTYYGVGSMPPLAGTSSGNTVLDTTDAWLVADPSPGGYPSVGHVWAGPGYSIPPTLVSSNSYNLNYTVTVTIPPTSTRIFMHFAVQANIAADAVSEVSDLYNLGGAALDGLSAAERAAIMNFVVP
jgi:hypothetical protein